MLENAVVMSYEWSDIDVLQIRTAFQCGDWSGSETTYVSRAELGAFADALDAVAAGGNAAALDTGASADASTSLVLREVGRARRLELDVCLARAAGSIRFGNDANPASRLERTVDVERGQIAAFANGLRALVQAEAGRATLHLARS